MCCTKRAIYLNRHKRWEWRNQLRSGHANFVGLGFSFGHTLTWYIIYKDVFSMITQEKTYWLALLSTNESFTPLTEKAICIEGFTRSVHIVLYFCDNVLFRGMIFTLNPCTMYVCAYLSLQFFSFPLQMLCEMFHFQ